MRDLREDHGWPELNLFDGEPEGPDLLPCQPSVAAGILLRTFRMYRAIDLDAEPLRCAVEIEDVRS